MRLAAAVEKRRKYLIDQLTFYGYNPIDLNGLTLSQLENEHIKVKCEIGSKLSEIDAEG